MSGAAGYMCSEAWRELVRGSAHGRPCLVRRRRPTSVNALMALAVGVPDHDFLVQGDRRITHGAFRAAVEAGAAALAAAGVRPGERLLIVLHNSPELWLAQCAAWRLGAVPVLGNRWWSAPEFDDAVRRIAPAGLASDLDPGVSPALRLTPGRIAAWWSAPVPRSPVPDPEAGIDEDDVAVIVFTAGSTGVPKGVELTHRNLVWTQQTIHALRGPPKPPAGPEAQRVALMTTPLFHNGGMVAALGLMIDGGRIVMLRGRFDAGEALAVIEAERVSAWSAVPTMFARVLRHPDAARRDLSSLTAPATGGSIVPTALVEEMTRRLPATAAGFTSGYGMTEMSFLTMAGARDLIDRPGTVGRIMPGVELKALDADAEGIGELAARSGALMRGYTGGEPAPIDVDGWFRTGDLGRIDADGFVHVTGRSKDMVIRGGENVACAHVEAAIAAHPDVLEVAVVAVPDAELGETVGAVVLLRPGAAADAAALTAHARARLAYFEVPSHWSFASEPLPVLPTGKLDKRRLAAGLAP